MTDIGLNIIISAKNQSNSVFGDLKNALGNIGFGLRNLATDGTVGMDAIGQGASGALGPILKLGSLAVVAGTGIAIAIGTRAVQAAGDFQQALDNDVAHAGLANSQINNVTQSLLKMGPAVGQGPTQLAQALYPILSSLSSISNQSAKTRIALAELQDASESVAGSTTSVTDVSNAASAAFNAYGLATNNANTNINRMNSLFDVMNATVSAGNMQWDSYSSTIGKLSVASHAAGVGFNEENAALADLTNSGYSAQNGATNLANLFTQLDLKTDTIAKKARAAGIAFDEQRFKTMTLGQQIQYLTQITDGNKSTILALMNNNSTAAKTFDALSGTIGQYNSNLNSLNHSQGSTAQSFAVASSSFNFSMKQLGAAGQSLLITLGLQLLPTVTKLVGKITPAVLAFTDWANKNHVAEKSIDAVKVAISTTINVVSTIIKIVQDAAQWFDKWHTIIQNTALIIGTAFAPAIIKAGVEASIAGAKIATQFIGSMIQSGVTAVTSGAKIAVNFVGSVIEAGVEGWASVVKIGAFIGSMIASGASAIANGAIIVASFVSSLVTSGIQAVISAGIMLSTLVPALAATAVAALAAAAPFIIAGLIIAAVVVGIILAVKNWGAISKWLQGVWQSFSAWFQGALQNIGHFFTVVWDGIKSFFSSALNFLISAGKTAALTLFLVITGPIGLIALYIISHWTQVSSWLTGTWDTLVSIASNTFALVSTSVQNGFNKSIAFIQNIWTVIKSVFSGAYNKYILQGLNTIWSGMNSLLGGWPAKMVQLGINTINGFVNGIKSAVGNVKGAISNIWSTISNFFPHSPPKEGPGKDLPNWGPRLVSLFSNDITSQSPKARAAAEAMMSQVAAAIKQYPNLIASAQQAGNKEQEQMYKQQLSMTKTQMTAYKSLVKEAGYKYDQYNLADPINFAPAKKAKYSANGLGPVYGSGGSSSTSTTSTNTGSTGGATYIVMNNTFVLPKGTTQQQAKQIGDIVDKELAKRMRRQGSYTTTSA